MIATSRQQRRILAKENAKLPQELQEIPRQFWPAGLDDPKRTRVWRSQRFLVQEFVEPRPVVVRLSVNRTTLDGLRWKEGISWDELQEIKNSCGYADADAVEIFPAQSDIVNVANMRHLWVMLEKLPFGWRRA